MKNQGKINATKTQVNNKAVISKDAIRAAVPSNGTALTPSKAFEEKNTDNLETNQLIPAGTVNQEPIILAETLIVEPTKMEIKEDLQKHKPALSLEETLILIKELAEKTANRATYNGYIDSLNKFIISQNDDDMGKKDDPSFKGCELRIKDGEGNVFVTSSASVIFRTVEFMKGRFNERLAEVEAEIVIPA